ncbi:putative Integral membrane protein [metagenome]|uniref:Putative Integral membrane protein n=1 Tax=metagenome TaxID=256318 RepID=A0A2P2BZM8_9ZZZZ
MNSSGITSCPLRDQVDPRALRFSAAATAGVLVVVLLTVGFARPLALGLLASQVAVFGFTAGVSVHWSVWAQIFARVIWPRIGAATELVEARPARFAQFIGFVVTVVALLGFIMGRDGLGYGCTAVAVVGAVINAITGVCLGCRIYLLAAGRRQGTVGRRTAS